MWSLSEGREGSVVVIRGSSHVSRTNTHKRLTRPVLVYMVLRPLVALFVRLQVVPSVATPIVHEQPPPRIVGERLFATLWNVERRVQFCELSGRHKDSGSTEGRGSKYLTVDQTII